MQIPLNELKRALKSLQSRYPEIRGLSMGKREKNGHHRLNQQDVIIIGVDKKIKHPRWSGRKKLPSKIWGIPTDIQEMNDRPVSDLSTPYIAHNNVGGSCGVFLRDQLHGFVTLTNRHVANFFPNSFWHLADEKNKAFCKPVRIAHQNVDAAVMRVEPYQVAGLQLKTMAQQYVGYAAPEIGSEVYYLGGMTNRREPGRIKAGTILTMGWGAIADPKMVDGIFTTVNFRFLNLKGDTASPIPGDSGSPVFTDIFGKRFLVGIVYAGGDRNQFCAAVPITNILNEFSTLDYGEQPIMTLPGFVKMEAYKEKEIENARLYAMYKRFEKASMDLNEQNGNLQTRIVQLEIANKKLEDQIK